MMHQTVDISLIRFEEKTSAGLQNNSGFLITQPNPILGGNETGILYEGVMQQHEQQGKHRFLTVKRKLA